MVPPEVIVDRWVRMQLCNKPRFSAYVGKLDIELVESPWLRSSLHLIQTTMNEALRLEGVNASGGVEHPPFHFDFLDVKEGIRNAHAFQYDGFAFIVVTMPMVESIWHVSQRLSRSPMILQLLRLQPETVPADELQSWLFEIQLAFLASHEYTHHIHRHCAEGQGEGNGLWTEFLDDEMSGSINSQAQELIADGYAVYLLLAWLLRGEGRERVPSRLIGPDMSGTEGEELRFTYFFVAILAFFCAFWRRGIGIEYVFQFSHPPAPIRIEYAIQAAEMWCDQNESVPQSWFNRDRFRALFRAAAEITGETAGDTWDTQESFLSSARGVQYSRQLFERFEAMRQKRDGLAQSTPEEHTA